MITLDQLDPKQREAVERCLDTNKRAVAVTGPAGSGKTTIMRMVYDALCDAGHSPVLCAPTGKAAKRIREATGIPAVTMHMLLEYGMPKHDDETGKAITDSYPKRDKDNPIEYDTVMGDEYMMVNRELHRNLVDAMPRGARLLAFGDVNQLPPIEQIARLMQEPAAFEMLLKKNGITLDRVHRQTEGSGILFNAQRILKGIPPQKTEDCDIVYGDQSGEDTGLRHKCFDACELADFTQLHNQIITPGNRGWIGTVKLNASLQLLLAPDTERFNIGRQKWVKQPLHLGVGDKVIMTKNWYDLECLDGSRGVFNGETGIVTEYTELGEVVVDFGDRICSIPPLVQVVINNSVVVLNPQKDLYLAYALTTHKTQGSEYHTAVYIMDKSLRVNLNRPNFYTGVTRGAKRVRIISDKDAMFFSLKNTKQFIPESRGFGV